jgi:hypothetical protein
VAFPAVFKRDFVFRPARLCAPAGFMLSRVFDELPTVALDNRPPELSLAVKPKGKKIKMGDETDEV